MQFSRDIIDEILARIDIAGLIGEYVTLKPSGKSLKGLCPFHQEKTPSFMVNPDRGFYKCFGCGEGGGAIQFIMKIENTSFPEAVRILAERTGVRINAGQPETLVESEKKILGKAMAIASRYYHKTLVESPIGRAGLSYLQQRGISLETIRNFELGFAPVGGDFLIRHLRGMKLDYEVMEKAGLVRRSGNEYYDYFRNRVIFPITDSQGRTVAMGGRAMAGDQVAKYLNTPETRIFIKGNVLYGLNQAKPAIRKQDSVYVVEGYMDALSLYQAGFQNVVASMGTSLTEKQAQTIARYTGNVIFAYDADSAGQSATGRGIGIFEKAGLYVKIMDIPMGEDPDSIIKKKGKDFFENLTSNSRGIIEYKIDNLENQSDMKTPEGKQEFVRKLIPIMAEIRGEIRRAEYARIISGRHGIPEKLILKALERQRTGKSILDASPLKGNRLSSPEDILLACILINPDYIPVCREYSINGDSMSKKHFRLYERLMDTSLEPGTRINAGLLNSIAEDEAQLKFAVDLMMKEGASDCKEEQLRMFLKRFEHEEVRKNSEKNFQKKLNDGTLDYSDPDFIKYIESIKAIKTPRN